MKMSFLCVRHRRWLSSDPVAALYTWLQCYQQGLKLEQQHRDELAIRQAGCAMETAELILNVRPGPDSDDIVRFTHSTLLLGRLLRRQGAHGNASEAAHHAIACLEHLLACGIQEQCVRHACEQLAPMTAPAVSTSAVRLRPNCGRGQQRLH
ncbi:MAG: hypothetical protein ACK5HY_00775 [Parahaliea sp.]